MSERSIITKIDSGYEPEKLHIDLEPNETILATTIFEGERNYQRDIYYERSDGKQCYGGTESVPEYLLIATIERQVIEAEPLSSNNSTYFGVP